MRAIAAISLATILIWSLAVPASADVVREDLWVPTEDDLRLYVRAVSDDASPAGKGPIVLVHGARVGSIASFDVDVSGFSLAAELAAAGHPVYLADLRGYGRSDFPPSMEGERFAAPPAVPTRDAVADLKNVLDAVARRHPDEPLTAMGWATGSHWLAATEAAHPGSIDRLVVYNSVYGGKGEWALTPNFSVEGHPSMFDYAKFGAYRLSDAKSLTGRWTEAETISQPFIERYVDLAMEGDPTADGRTPPSIRHPSGPIADTLKAVHEGPLYDADAIHADVLILRSGNDFWSRPTDVETLRDDLTSAASVTVLEIPGASHYVHLEPGDARQRLIGVVVDFADDGALDAPAPAPVPAQ